LVRAIQVVVNAGITRRQYNYLVWWYSRSRYRRMISKRSKRIFELRPNALSFYAIARLDEGLKKDGDLNTYLDYYPVGFKSDIPPLPEKVRRLFRRRKLRKRQYDFLSEMKLGPMLGPWGEWPELGRGKKHRQSASPNMTRSDP